MPEEVRLLSKRGKMWEGWCWEGFSRKADGTECGGGRKESWGEETSLMKPHSECCAINSHHQQKQPSLKKTSISHWCLMVYLRESRKMPNSFSGTGQELSPSLRCRKYLGYQKKKKYKVLVTSWNLVHVRHCAKSCRYQMTETYLIV